MVDFAMAKQRTSRNIKVTATKTGRFVLGRDGFGKISAVEGIVLSRGLEADLRQLEGALPQKRRAMLARRYGKN